MFPASPTLGGRRVVVVGGGPVAAAKIDPLVEAGARVTVVAPEIRAEIDRAGIDAGIEDGIEPGLEIVRREFRAADLDGAWWVVAAAPPAVNRAVQAAA